MSRYPAIAFHAGADWVPTPNTTIQEVLAYAHSHGADYFVLDERETISLRPQLAELIQTGRTPGLEWLAEIDDEGEKLVIYRVVQ